MQGERGGGGVDKVAEKGFGAGPLQVRVRDAPPNYPKRIVHYMEEDMDNRDWAKGVRGWSA